MTDPCAGGFPCPDCGADHDIPGCPDAAALQPVAWRWRIRGTIALGSPRYSASKPTEKNAYDIQPLYAEPPEHPEDAPEGPWEIGSTADQDVFLVKSGPYAWKEAVAVRDQLNRLRGDEK